MNKSALPSNAVKVEYNPDGTVRSYWLTLPRGVREKVIVGAPYVPTKRSFRMF